MVKRHINASGSSLTFDRPSGADGLSFAHYPRVPLRFTLGYSRVLPPGDPHSAIGAGDRFSGAVVTKRRAARKDIFAEHTA